jgi:hypothetical protein
MVEMSSADPDRNVNPGELSSSPANPSSKVNAPGQPAQDKARDKSDGSVNPGLLDEVLQNTLSLNSISPRELSDLIDIGRRYFGQPLVEDPIGVELVEVVLRNRLAAVTAEGDRRREMARQITESLLNDPTCEPRLRAFWDQLLEAAR